MNKKFPALLSRLRDMLSFVSDQAGLAGFASNQIIKIELAAEEALVNIIRYGYIDQNDGIIEIDCQIVKNKEITIVIKDPGIPYNPLDPPKEIDVHAPLEARKLGGYGIFHILMVMDKVNYERKDNFNVLMLTKYLL